MITIFRNIQDTSAPFYKEIRFALERVRVGKSEELITAIRKETDKTKRNDLKKNLPSICFSGTFKKRADGALIEHSGYICLDFDGYETKEAMLSDKKVMASDQHVLSVFISPSGNGLKVVVKIPQDPDNHKRYFNALRDYFDSPYFDETSKNISRVCYESFDPDIYINYDSVLWENLADFEPSPVDRYDAQNTIILKDENSIVERLMIWWNKKYGLVDGERNHNVFKLAAAFNDFGVNKSLAEYVMGQMATRDFPLREIKTTIDSAYRHTDKFGTKFYEDEAELHRIKSKINKGASSDEIKKDLRRLEIEDDVISEVVSNLENDSHLEKFWTKSDKGKISIIHIKFKTFLEQNGFYKFSPHDSDKYLFVRVTNNLIDKTTEEDIKDMTLNHLLKFDDLSVYNYFADMTRFFKKDFLSLIDTVNVHFVEDTKHFSYIYFRNCALKVSADNIEPIDYVDLGGFVWRDQVIDRDWMECDIKKCDFRTFISRLAGDEEARIKSFESTIGFLMSGYKDPGFCPAVILNDEVITDLAEGGTGKGLFVQGIGAMKQVSTIDGKMFSFEKAFPYQTVKTDTQVIAFDDVKRGFHFERLFSVVTEGITIEKKNKDAFNIPFRYSPKIVITTNYAIKGDGNSHIRRKWELEFRQHYTSDFTPVHEFGKRFFDEWNEEEWCSFDNYMIGNLQLYLSEGLIKSDFKNLAIRKLAAATSHEFIDWCGLVEGSKISDVLGYDKKILMNDLYQDFTTDNPDYAPRAKYTISRREFYQWLHKFATHMKGVESVEGRDSMGKWIIFKTKDFEGKTDEPDIEF